MKSALQMQQRLNLITETWLKSQVKEIVLSDNQTLKAEKINEWEQGLNPDGSKIGVYRDAEYAIFKDNINPRGDGYVDLLLTRRTASSLFITSNNKGFIFKMNDRYNLVGKYSDSILGINQEWFNNRQKDVYKIALSYQIQKVLFN